MVVNFFHFTKCASLRRNLNYSGLVQRESLGQFSDLGPHRGLYAFVLDGIEYIADIVTNGFHFGLFHPSAGQGWCAQADSAGDPVSYTHLTLPTILRV